jgi:uncharacterized protein YggE
MLRSVIVLCLVAVSSLAQATPPASVTATGQATASASPDQAIIAVAVTTSATTAIDTSNQNAVLTSSVISALKALMGSGDTLQTVGYSLNQNYNNQGIVTGYTATNTIQVTTADLTATGKLIDTATQAGATRVQSLSFGLKDSQPLRAQALQLAAAKAQTQVQAIATGLGVKLGAVLSASDGSSASTSQTLTPGVAAASTITPIVTGAVQVTASVTLRVAIAQ